ncbi:MAG TPA: hypothetical protein VNK96_07215 [Fimbriimonadales bacterium]|nr:hypothetical protein [Fimbriimonadales bacterium]
MMKIKFLICILSVLLVSQLNAQGWRDAYEKGLAAAKKGDWANARAHFLEAKKNRPQDSDKSSYIGSGVTSKTLWRDGALYSPNFAAAYCAFKLAAQAEDLATRNRNLDEAIAEFKALLDAGQVSVETIVFLSAAYTAKNDLRAASDIQEKLTTLDPKKAFKVDREVLDANDLRILASSVDVMPPGSRENVKPDEIAFRPGAIGKYGIVPPLDYKFALLIGNAKNSGQVYAHNDVDLLKTNLMKHAGYMETNIVTLKDATTQVIMDAAKSLAEKMPENGTIFIFFSGVGVYNPQNQTDYLAGAEVTDLTAFDQMLPKAALFEVFMKKGATIFIFYQVDRPKTSEGYYFGLEVPMLGKIAQCFGCAPGEVVNAISFENKIQGVYGLAISKALEDMHTNRIPIVDFAWKVFEKTREGSAERGGGGQTPTLPVLTNLGGSAKF